MTIAPVEEAHGDHPGVEGHADPVIFLGFVPPGVIAVLRELCARAGSRAASASGALDELERRLTLVDTWARLATLAVAGDSKAVLDLRALAPKAFASSAGRPSAPHDHSIAHDHARDCPDEGTSQVAFLGDRVLEAALGFFVACGTDRKARAATLAGLRAHLVPLMSLTERLYARALLARAGEANADEVFALLRTFASACEQGASTELLAVHCSQKVDGILDAVETLAPALEEALFVDQDPAGLTLRIASITTTRSDGILRASLSASPNALFPDHRPEDVAAFCQPSARDAKIESWSAKSVTLILPEDAKVGPVFFSRKSPASPRAAFTKLGHAVAGHISSPANVQLFGIDPVRVSIVGNNIASFVVPPSIGSFLVQNARGERLGTKGIAAGEPVHVLWNVVSSDSETTVTLETPQASLAVPTAGRLTVHPEESGTIRIVATNVAGTVSHGSDVRLVRYLVHDAPFVCARPASTTQLTIATSHPRVPVAYLRIDCDGGGRIVATIEPLSDRSPRLEVQIIGEPGPGIPTRLLVSSPGYVSLSIEVWVERPKGLWQDGPRLDGVAVHMALLKTGKVLTFAADHRDFHSMHKADSFVWDPSTNEVRRATFDSDEHINLFCSGHCLLADGRVLVAGGHSAAFESTAREVHTFNPDTETWVKHAPMEHWRWYPTVTTLPDGRALILSGSRSLVGRPVVSVFWEINNDVEIFNPRDSSTTSFPFAFEAIDRQAMYPHLFPLPGGRMFTHLFDTTRVFERQTPPWLTPPPRSFATVERVIRTDRGYVTCVILPLASDERRRVRIFVAGGCDVDSNWRINSNTPASDGAEIFDYDADAPETSAWRLIPERLPRRRFMTNGVLLPDETVLLVNGAERGSNDCASLPVFEPVILNPAAPTDAFRRMEPTSDQHPRLYHGTALLLPDGRVVVGGHTEQWNPHPYDRNDFQLQLFHPPYLFRGPRPTLAWAPAFVGHGQEFEIDTPDASWIEAVTFIRCSSVTHQLNTDQRCFRLRIVGYEGSSLPDGVRRLRVQAPVDPSLAIPGYYLLFLLSRQVGDGCGKVPSIAKLVRLG